MDTKEKWELRQAGDVAKKKEKDGEPVLAKSNDGAKEEEEKKGFRPECELHIERARLSSRRAVFSECGNVIKVLALYNSLRFDGIFETVVQRVIRSGNRYLVSERDIKKKTFTSGIV